MKLANLAGRLVVITANGATDVEEASFGAFGPDPQSIYEHWDSFTAWAATSRFASARAFTPTDLRAPAPAPRQLFAMGFNYRDHAEEVGAAVNSGLPPVFTKFVSAITGPYCDVTLPDGSVDWEVELVAVISRRAWQISEHDAWAHIAGLTVGQDISERVTQLHGSTPQFSLGKSFPGFAPMGPRLVTPDELSDPDDLRLTCAVNGEVVQHASTAQLIAPISALISRLSAVVPLLPGDVVFTGTPGGVGMGRTPQRYLRLGDELTSSIEGIGMMCHRIVAPAGTAPKIHRERTLN